MKVAFISDIHGNAVALEAVLKDIETKNVDKIIVLGDICYRGPEPKRALDMIRSLDTTVIKGNADEWIVRGIQEGEVPAKVLNMMRVEQVWAVGKLEDSDLQYLASLPEQHNVQLTDQLEVTCFHATPNSLFEVVQPDEEDDVLRQKLSLDGSGANIVLYGHIHKAYVRFVEGKAVVNLGSVGLPFDGINQSSYVIVEGEGSNFSISHQRVKFETEKVIALLDEVDYPNKPFLVQVLKTAKI